MPVMCGRVTQRSGELPGLVTIMGDGRDSRVKDAKDYVRYNGAPSQDFWIVRKHPKSGEYQRDRMTWGLIPYWCKDRMGGRKSINAKAETVASLPSFRDAYARRRCLLPVDNFFEWKAIKGQPKQPYAIAMKSGEPFALAAIWENWGVPGTEEWMRTFCIITTTANELLSEIHDRMPVILPPAAYDRWLANVEPAPRDLLVPFPSEPMRMWPISARVNKPENDDPSILGPPSSRARDPTLLCLRAQWA
jgi:putative SOS response-associated peptidase YedK